MDSTSTLEECPLQGHHNCQRRPRSFKGPLRLLRLCILSFLMPVLLIALPLYLRYHVYGDQVYPFAMSDMRVLDNRVSTVWCQRQHVKVNTTFNAFLLESEPRLANHFQNVSMERHLLLDDDMKEYWGFYLLKGSSVTVSVCSRWPGGSLTVIRGHKNLHQCAYIGDDSSEEIEELIENIREGVPFASSQESESQAISNDPKMMKKHRAEVKFHHPHHLTNKQLQLIEETALDTSDISDPKLIKEILKEIALKAETQNRRKQFQRVDDSLEAQQNRRYKNNEKEVMMVQHINEQNVLPAMEMPFSSTATLPVVSNRTSKNENVYTPQDTLEKDASMTLPGQILNSLNLTDTNKFVSNVNNATVTESISEAENQSLDRKPSRNKTSSEETIDELYQRLNALGSKKVSALRTLNQRLMEDMEDQKDETDIVKRRRRRRKRDLVKSLMNDLNVHDEERDLALEEGFEPDGIADHRGVVNETTPNDMSNSEIWSSFSSSEEALLDCAGLILNLPLTPHTQCLKEVDHHHMHEAFLTNTITYVVPTNGYYFFIFNSENEIQTNYIRVKFNLTKTVYDVSNSVSMCKNKTKSCALDLKFFSKDRVVLELPVLNNDSMWNEEFIVMSECEPRTILYVICVISVPVMIVLFAFQ